MVRLVALLDRLLCRQAGILVFMVGGSVATILAASLVAVVFSFTWHHAGGLGAQAAGQVASATTER